MFEHLLLSVDGPPLRAGETPWLSITCQRRPLKHEIRQQQRQQMGNGNGIGYGYGDDEGIFGI